MDEATREGRVFGIISLFRFQRGEKMSAAIERLERNFEGLSGEEIREVIQIAKNRALGSES